MLRNPLANGLAVLPYKEQLEKTDGSHCGCSPFHGGPIDLMGIKKHPIGIMHGAIALKDLENYKRTSYQRAQKLQKSPYERVLK